jgi:hypothetical protein
MTVPTRRIGRSALPVHSRSRAFPLTEYSASTRTRDTVPNSGPTKMAARRSSPDSSPPSVYRPSAETSSEVRETVREIEVPRYVVAERTLPRLFDAVSEERLP